MTDIPQEAFRGASQDAERDAAQALWSLGDGDRAVLRQLITDLRRLLPLARSNEELIVLGDVISAVEKVRNGEGVEEILTLSVGVQDGNDSFNEGWFIRLGLSPEGIVLDKLNTTFTVEMGHDRVATSYAVLQPGGGFDNAGVASWLTQLNEMRRWSTAEITGERYPL